MFFSGEDYLLCRELSVCGENLLVRIRTFYFIKNPAFVLPRSRVQNRKKKRCNVRSTYSERGLLKCAGREMLLRNWTNEIRLIK
jgi:hypothetical protein